MINTTIRGGIATPTEDYRALADSIKTLYTSSPDERSQMGSRLRDYHFEHLERGKVLAQLFSFMFDTRQK